MLSRSGIAALGIAVFIVTAIVSFPAALAHRWFSPADLALAGIQGSVWSGNAAHGAVGGIAFSNLQWRLNPVALLTGKLDVIVDEVRIGNGSVRAHVTASGSRATISLVDLIIDLAPFRAALALGDVQGQVSARELQIEIVDGWPVAASGEARIGGLAVPPLLPIEGVDRVQLGNFRAELVASEEPGIVMVLNDEGGPIELAGTFRLTPARVYEFDTRIRTRPDAAQVLIDGIELVAGPPDSSGMRSFRQSGSL